MKTLNCRAVQDLLPEYIAGHALPDRERVAGHLSRCEVCDAGRRELEAVFALLATAPGPPDSPYAEANVRLALRTEFAPGPLQAERQSRRRDDVQFGVCAAFSLSGTAGVMAGAAFLWKTPELGLHLNDWGSRELARLLSTGPLWPGVALLVLMGGMAGMLPALLQHRAPTHKRRVRREV